MPEIMTHGVMPEMISDKTGYGIAADIGTTTMVVYLYDMKTRKCLSTQSRMNAQVQYGSDVISRIQYCDEQQDGLRVLQRTVVDELNQMIKEACAAVGILAQDVCYGVVTGNTTMLHLLAGLSPETMGVLPFKPLSYFGETVEMSMLGIFAAADAVCYLPPCMSAFVGGDISCALLPADFLEGQEVCLLMDIGTNGELVVGNREFVYSTSTAAGPAFEGAHIKYGMAGVKGAVSRVYENAGHIKTGVIGNVRARGICGSGLLDAIALLRQENVIDETGRITKTHQEWQCVYDGQDAIKIADDVLITQQDIREVQMAKAAIAAGVKALLNSAKMTCSDIKRVYLAGGFGNYMNQRSARAIGLLPVGLNDVVNIGNAAGTGAVMTLLNDSCREKMQQACNRARHIELGHNPYFMEKYMEEMCF